MNLSEMGFIRRSEWSNLESHFKITKKSNLKTCLNDTKTALTFESSLAKQVISLTVHTVWSIPLVRCGRLVAYDHNGPIDICERWS